MKKTHWLSIGLILLVVVGYFGWQYAQLQSEASKWDGPIADIDSEKVEKEGAVMRMDFTSRIDAPTKQVFNAMTAPERGQELSSVVKAAKLLESEGNRKVVRMEVELLGMLQEMTAEFTFFPQDNRITMKTIDNPMADLEGEYRFSPSPDGKQTVLHYTATSTDKFSLPIPEATQKSAAREMFVSTVRALKKGLAAQNQAAQP
jgi:ribosome-associated toxin RatA of RatAB toxin-antitoxin module